MNDSDSGYDERSSSHTSVHSSVYDYEQENGRTYHAYKAGRYPLPNDVEEQNRMDSKFFLALLSCLTDGFALTSLLPCPSPSPQR